MVYYQIQYVSDVLFQVETGWITKTHYRGQTQSRSNKVFILNHFVTKWHLW